MAYNLSEEPNSMNGDDSKGHNLDLPVTLESVMSQYTESHANGRIDLKSRFTHNSNSEKKESKDRRSMNRIKNLMKGTSAFNSSLSKP